MTRRLKIAAAQYPLDPHATMADYRAKVTRWAEEAAGGGAELAVFPEYGAMELGAIAGPDVAKDLQGVIDAVSERLPEADALHGELARRLGMTIVAASGPERQPDGRTLNVSRIFGPGGAAGRFVKIMMTPWERDPWRISGGSELMVFDIGTARVGLVICYDIEFPLIARALAEAGADVILAPSQTESEYGWWRVRTGCMARALENQLYTVHSPTVGSAPWCPPVEGNCGSAGVYGPSDQGLPPGGILALGRMNEPLWVRADLDLDLMAGLRQDGAVRTFDHWAEQPGAGPLPAATVVDLTGKEPVRAAAE